MAFLSVFISILKINTLLSCFKTFSRYDATGLKAQNQEKNIDLVDAEAGLIILLMTPFSSIPTRIQSDPISYRSIISFCFCFTHVYVNTSRFRLLFLQRNVLLVYFHSDQSKSAKSMRNKAGTCRV